MARREIRREIMVRQIEHFQSIKSYVYNIFHHLRHDHQRCLMYQALAQISCQTSNATHPEEPAEARRSTGTRSSPARGTKPCERKRGITLGQRGSTHQPGWNTVALVKNTLAYVSSCVSDEMLSMGERTVADVYYCEVVS